MLFGDEFDFNERAEVDGGLRRSEMKLADIASVLLEDRSVLTEDGLAEVFPAVDAHGDGGDFVAVHLSNSGLRHGLRGNKRCDCRTKERLSSKLLHATMRKSRRFGMKSGQRLRWRPVIH